MLDSGVLDMVGRHSSHQQIREDGTQISEFRRHGEVHFYLAYEVTDLPWEGQAYGLNVPDREPLASETLVWLLVHEISVLL